MTKLISAAQIKSFTGYQLPEGSKLKKLLRKM